MLAYQWNLTKIVTNLFIFLFKKYRIKFMLPFVDKVGLEAGEVTWHLEPFEENHYILC